MMLLKRIAAYLSIGGGIFLAYVSIMILYGIVKGSSSQPIGIQWFGFVLTCLFASGLVWSGHRIITHMISRGEEKTVGQFQETSRLIANETIIVKVPSSVRVLSANQRRPWVRFFARVFDFYLISVGIAATLYLIVHQYSGAPALAWKYYITYMLAIYTLFVILDAFMLATFGTTPGKALLRIRVMDGTGQKLRFWKALKRTLGLYFIGFGIAISAPIFLLLMVYVLKVQKAGLPGLFGWFFILVAIAPGVALVTFIWSYVRLRRTGETWWDRQAVSVIHGTFGWLRAAGFTVMLLVLVVVASELSRTANPFLFPLLQMPIQQAAPPFPAEADVMAKNQDYISLIQYLRAKRASPQILEWLKNKAIEGHPPLQFELSRWLSNSDLPESLMWLHQAQLSTAQDATLCEDNTARAATSAMVATYGDVAELAVKNPQIYREAAERSLKMNEGMVNRPSALWVCSHGLKAFDGNAPTLIPKDQWQEVRTKVRLDFSELLIKKLDSPQ